MPRPFVPIARAAALPVAILSLLMAGLPVLAVLDAPLAQEVEAGAGHLVISELQTGGASASDEFVELDNPTDVALPLEGLELVYVTASGSTATRKAAWALGAPPLGAGQHLLVVNEAGIHAGIGDLAYGSGVAATGGAWALRIQGAATAIDAVGWGTATAWLETRAALAPGSGASLERLPGGAQGSTQDTDDNLVDFITRDVPDPQNAVSPPVPDPNAPPTPLPTPAASPAETPPATPLATPAPTPAEEPISIAAARAMPDGAIVTIRGTALTDGAFGEGGGYLADESGGMAIIVDEGTFPRGHMVEVTGELDDRYAQRTIRAVASAVTVLATAADPAPVDIGTGAVGEAVEGQLVAIEGAVSGAATSLSGGVGVDVDDGGGPVRVFIGTATGIDLAAWSVGTSVALHGVVGQRDSSGSGTAGYRVQPRDPADILAVEPPAPEPTATPSGSGSPGASATPAPDLPLLSVEAARRAATNARVRVRGVVTVASGAVEPGSAVVQDTTAGILVRIGDDAGALARGELVELSGVRSTKGGMLTLRVTEPPLRLGHATEPAALRVATGTAGEAQEVRLVVVRGAVTGRVSRLTAGGASFEIDDGSGPLRIAFSGRASLGQPPATGTWVEIRGALGQETSGSQPLRGYRVWPRASDDVTIVAGATDPELSGGAAAALGGTSGGTSGGDGDPADPAGPAGGGREPALATRGTGGQRPGTPTGPAHRPTEPPPASRHVATGMGLLLLGLAGLLGGGTAAWRTGAIGRLRRPTDDLETPLRRDEEMLEPLLAPLTVVGGSPMKRP